MWRARLIDIKAYGDQSLRHVSSAAVWGSSFHGLRSYRRSSLHSISLYLHCSVQMTLGDALNINKFSNWFRIPHFGRGLVIWCQSTYQKVSSDITEWWTIHSSPSVRDAIEPGLLLGFKCPIGQLHQSEHELYKDTIDRWEDQAFRGTIFISSLGTKERCFVLVLYGLGWFVLFCSYKRVSFCDAEIFF